MLRDSAANCLLSCGDNRTDRYLSRISQLRSKTPTRGVKGQSQVSERPPIIDRLDVYIKYQHSFNVLAKIIKLKSKDYFLTFIYTVKNNQFPRVFHRSQAVKKIGLLFRNILQGGFAGVKFWAKEKTVQRFNTVNFKLQSHASKMIAKYLQIRLYKKAWPKLTGMAARLKKVERLGSVIASATRAAVVGAVAKIRKKMVAELKLGEGGKVISYVLLRLYTKKMRSCITTICLRNRTQSGVQVKVKSFVKRLNRIKTAMTAKHFQFIRRSIKSNQLNSAFRKQISSFAKLGFAQFMKLFVGKIITRIQRQSFQIIINCCYQKQSKCQTLASKVIKLVSIRYSLAFVKLKRKQQGRVFLRLLTTSLKRTIKNNSRSAFELIVGYYPGKGTKNMIFKFNGMAKRLKLSAFYHIAAKSEHNCLVVRHQQQKELVQQKSLVQASTQKRAIQRLTLINMVKNLSQIFLKQYRNAVLKLRGNKKEFRLTGARMMALLLAKSVELRSRKFWQKLRWKKHVSDSPIRSLACSKVSQDKQQPRPLQTTVVKEPYLSSRYTLRPISSPRHSLLQQCRFDMKRESSERVLEPSTARKTVLPQRSQEMSLRLCKKLTKLMYVLELKAKTSKDYSFFMIVSTSKAKKARLNRLEFDSNEILNDTMHFLSERENRQNDVLHRFSNLIKSGKRAGEEVRL